MHKVGEGRIISCIKRSCTMIQPATIHALSYAKFMIQTSLQYGFSFYFLKACLKKTMHACICAATWLKVQWHLGYLSHNNSK